MIPPLAELPISSEEVSVLLCLATQAAREAGKILLSYFKDPYLQIFSKKNASIVTQADLKAQAHIIEVLQQAPQAFRWGFLAEEENVPASSPCVPLWGRWLIDPLDGTTNFSRGFPFFCVSIGLECQGSLVLGVIHAPLFQETYTTQRGQGSFLNAQRLAVSSQTQLSRAVLSTGFSHHAPNLPEELKILGLLQASSRGVRRTGSAALDLAYTAKGTFDGFWGKNLCEWDIAAGALLVEEAGGNVTNFEGSPMPLTGESLLATTPNLHPVLMEKIKYATQLPL